MGKAVYESLLNEMRTMQGETIEQAFEVIDACYHLMGCVANEVRKRAGEQSADALMYNGMLQSTQQYVQQMVTGLAMTALSRLLNSDYPPSRITKLDIPKNVKIRGDE